MKTTRRGIASFALALCVGASWAWAQGVSSPTSDQGPKGWSPSCPAIEKLGRGLSNIVGGWMEIPAGMERRYTAHDTAGSLLTGVLYGVFNSVARTSVGAYEALTFFLPVPKDFAPILPTLGYFDQATKRNALPLE